MILRFVPKSSTDKNIHFPEDGNIREYSRIPTGV
jgi:hypothetical protein